MRFPSFAFRRERPPLWVLMHVPKTAGATLTAALSRTMGPGRVLRTAWFDELQYHSKQRGLSDVQMVSCHIAGRELPYLAADRRLRLFTFLRDPVDRVLSTYRFWRQETPDALVEDRTGRPVKLVDLTLDWQEDLARILMHADEVWKFQELSDAATWQLATSLYERDVQSPDEVLRAAKARLRRMEFVGFQESIDTDYRRFCRRHLRVADPAPLPEINRTNREVSRDVPPELLDLIRQRNGRDLALYHWALRRFRVER